MTQKCRDRLCSPLPLFYPLVDPVSPSTMSFQIRTKCSQSDIEGNISKEYKLNINKALKKKLEATQRDRSVSYNHTTGGIVITRLFAMLQWFCNNLQLMVQ